MLNLLIVARPMARRPTASAPSALAPRARAPIAVGPRRVGPPRVIPVMRTGTASSSPRVGGVRFFCMVPLLDWNDMGPPHLYRAGSYAPFKHRGSVDPVRR